MIERLNNQTSTDVTFALSPEHQTTGNAVSVVGDFNNWDPGASPLVPRPDGSRAVTVRLPAGERVWFRYLTDAGQWFDEDDADGHDGQDSYLDL